MVNSRYNHILGDGSWFDYTLKLDTNLSFELFGHDSLLFLQLFDEIKRFGLNGWKSELYHLT